eukprot:c26570_g1_i1 orf=614-1708(-)
MAAPLLLPLNADLTAFSTFFCIDGREFAFDVLGVPPPEEMGSTSLRDAKLQCDSEVRMLLRGFENVVQQRLRQCTDLATFVLELKDIIESIVCVQPKASLPKANFCAHIFSELDTLGWEHLARVGQNLCSMHLQIFDEAGREHILEDMPCVIDLEWNDGMGLKHVLDLYKQAICRYQGFWTVMEDIDKKVWVMEPEHPSKANKFRRIALGGHCSLSITVDPLAPHSIPECRFLGSDTIIAPLRKRMNCNIKKWKTNRLLLANLEDVLEMTFPSPQDTVHEDISSDCGICYAFRLSDGKAANSECKQEGSIPDRACDNATCGRPFHTTCLVEWLRSITTTRQSFDVLFGNCPYCTHPIAVKAALI